MKKLLSLAAALLLAFFVFPASALAVSDQRVYAHGMNYLRDPKNGRSYLIWSDAYKSGVLGNGSWTHDVFFRRISISSPSTGGKRKLIGAHEAQEPASAAAAGDGRIIVSFEDGNDAGSYTLAQRYAVYDKDLRVIKRYPSTIAMGGHSGHASATKDRFVVFWNDGWIDGGGSDGLGTGDDLYVTSLKTNGRGKRTIPVSVGKNRDWWPLAASSGSRTLLVWQRYAGDSCTHLCWALFDPKKCRLVKTSGPDGLRAVHELSNMDMRYYTYAVTWLPGTERFLINATELTGGKKSGVLLLFDKKGGFISKTGGFPAFVRESAPAVKTRGSGDLLCFPSDPSGAFFVKADKSGVSLQRTAAGSYKWSYRGTSGFFGRGNKAYFASLGKRRVDLLSFKG